MGWVMPLRERAGAGIGDLDAQVLIVGTGPTGPTLAGDPARRGVRFRTIEQAPEPLAADDVDGDALVLVRPDGHIGLLARPGTAGPGRRRAGPARRRRGGAAQP